MKRSDVLVLARPRSRPSLAIAGCRAGARGFADLEHDVDVAAGISTLSALERSTEGSFGARLGRVERSTLDDLLDRFAPRLAWVILAGGEHAALAALALSCREHGVEVLLEAIDARELRLALRLSVDGIVLKGQESGGRVGDATSFVLVQEWQKLCDAESRAAGIPFWVQGGVGLHTAAACLAAGGRGVVLSDQLLLTRESRLSDVERSFLAAFDGSGTRVVGAGLGESVRLALRPGSPAAEAIACEEQRLSVIDDAAARLEAWRRCIRETAVGDDRVLGLVLGQDAAFARPLADRYVTVGGVVGAIVEEAEQHISLAKRLAHLDADSPLARSHKTRYPILQGPMTRVSDTAPFADAVARGGGLPFLALALLRREPTEELLARTSELLEGRPWGVGILGFVPPEIRDEQVQAILQTRPPFALIAGGRPSQARELEAHGIPTYLHVPSPGLLEMFLKDGARRFIFEGRECGGHVGPRTSFVLWESMCRILLDRVGPSCPAEEIHAVFAGGIHDARSAAMVAAISARLAERGIKVGVLLGTGYLFTREATEAGAVVERFQAEALTAESTVLLETSPGHAIRCVATPYCEEFRAERERLVRDGRSHDEIVRALELMNIGRLRIASKGLDHATGGGTSPVEDAAQYERGMYMIGDLCRLRDRLTTIAELHEEVAVGGSRLVRSLAEEVRVTSHDEPRPSDVAIIGMSCFYPKAGNLAEYWENILRSVFATQEIPASHWDWRLYYDADPQARDRSISKWGGFLGDVPFDPLTYGIAPRSVASIEPLQLLLLEAVRHALRDAGYDRRPFDRKRTAAVLGIGGGATPMAVSYGFRTMLPLLDLVEDIPTSSREILDRMEGVLPEWTEDSFPGFLMNVAVGRVANRFDLGGSNYAIDAACASSLAAVHACLRELDLGTADVALAMGADTVQTPHAYVAFSKTHALSAKGRCQPFDAAADGIVLAEGIGVLVLKRLADAERDGDRVYAVIKAAGSSSDGKDKGLTAPNTIGQTLALRRAYARAGISPARVGLIEAHGTGTVVGDKTEAASVSEVLAEAGAAAASCAIGSVKSMIGHAKCAAGVAGLIKATKAVYHRTLPPTLVDRPTQRFDFASSPLYLNTRARPWVHGADSPRCAGVSAFGFGGTNTHVVIEEYRGAFLDDAPPPALEHWPAELFVWRRGDREALLQAVREVATALGNGAKPAAAALAAALWSACPGDPSLPILTVVAESLEDLREKLARALDLLAAPGDQLHDPRGIDFAERPRDHGGKIALLFPGQGSQYPDMLAEQALAFPEIQDAFDRAERVLRGALAIPLGRIVFPPSSFDAAGEREAEQALAATEVAQPAIGASSVGLLHLLRALGVSGDLLAGHSYGELVALHAAGVMDEAELLRLSHLRGSLIRGATVGGAGGMAAIDAGAELVEEIAGQTGVVVANYNSPRQTVISGTDAAIDQALELLASRGLRGRRIPVSCAFHSPLVASVAEPLAAELRRMSFAAPRLPVLSNVTGDLYPAEPRALAELLGSHLASPVRFQSQIERMYDSGARVFVEVGPHAVLTGLVHDILRDRPHTAVALDAKGRSGIVQLHHALGRLLTAGVAVDLGRLHAPRALKRFDLAELAAQTGETTHSPTTVMVNGVRSRQVGKPEPLVLGQRIPRGLGRGPSPLGGTVPAAATSSSGTAPGTVPRAGQSPDDPVLQRFQDVMTRFLETQRAVMMAYLGETGAELLEPAARSHEALPSFVPPSVPVEQPGESEPEPVVQEVAPPRVALSREGLSARLLELVSERTGYPKEMLGLDLDLEAELGVDSIKRVEILGVLAESLGNPGESVESRLDLEKLTSVRTLRGIAEYFEAAFAEPAAAGPSAPGAAVAAAARDESIDAVSVRRGVLQLVRAPLRKGSETLVPKGAVLLTDDGLGIAAQLARRLSELGQPVGIVRMANGERRLEEENGLFHADLNAPEAVQSMLERVRGKLGAVAGLVHLLPFAGDADGQPAEAIARRDVRSLYLLTRALEDDLRKAGASGGAFVLAPTAMGGGLGFNGAVLTHPTLAGHGGILGFVKCLRQEWPEVLVRGVDLDAARPQQELVERILGELTDREGPCEVGYSAGERVTWRPVAAPLEARVSTQTTIDSDTTILLTGGARGITAVIALELARRFRPNLVLVGRSDLTLDEPAELAELEDVGAIKAALIERRRQEGGKAAPAEIEDVYRRLMRAREARRNLSLLRATGARVEYRRVDVRDEPAVVALLREIEAEFGEISGVIHGAGVTEDKLVRDKTPESFDRVFRTKVDGAMILARHLDPSRLRFFVMFGSVSGRFGNRGQADYAAANEVLGKLAADLDRRWPARVVSIDWGPWAEVGMASELARHMAMRGMSLISPDEGAALLLDELRFGEKGECEVLIGGGEPVTDG